MRQTPPPVVKIILRYDTSLQSYARRLVKDQAVAAAIVKAVFEMVYELNGYKVNDKTLRSLFTGAVFKMASLWQQHSPSVSNPKTTKTC